MMIKNKCIFIWVNQNILLSLCHGKKKKTFHKKKKHESNAFRKLKHIPYGSVRGWGGYVYNHKFGENETCEVNKNKARNDWKKEIKKHFLDETNS